MIAILGSLILVVSSFCAGQISASDQEIPVWLYVIMAVGGFLAVQR